MIKIFRTFSVLLFIAFLVASCRTQKGASKADSPTYLDEMSPDQVSYAKQRKFDRLFFEANKQKMLGNYEAALEKFKQAYDVVEEPAAAYEMANLYLGNGDVDNALTYAKIAAKANPKNKWYLKILADVHNVMGDYIEEAKVYEKIVAIDPNDIDVYFSWASAYLQADEYNKAVDVYSQLQDIIGIDEDITLQKVRIYQFTQNKNAALAEVQSLIDAFPSESRYQLMKAELYQNFGQNDEASKIYMSLAETNPSNPEVQLALADFYRASGDNDKSYEYLKAAVSNPLLDIDPKIEVLLSYYTITQSNPELLPQAYELAGIITDVHPEDPKGYSILGDFLNRDGKLEEARAAFRKSAEMGGNEFPIWNQIILIDSDLQDFEALKVEGAKTIELFPSQPFPYLLTGVANIQTENYQEAADVLEIGINYVVNNNVLKAEFYSFLGEAYNKLEEYKKSDKNFDKSLKLNPNNAGLLNNYAYYLSLRGERLDEALAFSEKSNQLSPGSSTFLDTYAWVLYKQGNYAEAKTAIEKAINTSGNVIGEIYEHYGDILFKLGEIDNAIIQWKKAKEAGDVSDLIDKKITDKKLYE